KSIVTSRQYPIHVFIVSWTGKHEASRYIAKKVRALAVRTTIIYSDVDQELAFSEKDIETVKVDNEWYWGRKFQYCLKHCKEDILLIIHADTECTNWRDVIQRCSDSFGALVDLGVYSPEIDYTFWSLDKTAIE